MLPLRLISAKTKFNFMKYRFVAFAISLAISILTVVLLFTKGLNFGIDFSGGILMEVRANEAVVIEDFRNSLSDKGYYGATIQSFGNEGNVLIRVQPKESEVIDQEVKNIKEILENEVDPNIEFRRVESVGPKVGDELVKSGLTALAVALVCMLFYIWFRFDWQFGIGVVIALTHDAIATLGFYIVSGFEFDLSSIAAILTVIGYSINDTVVVYDRVRENLRKHKDQTLYSILNLSLNETLSRTIMTVATTLVACSALIFFGGEVLKGFSLALFFGIAFGTYSSIFISVPVLIYTGLKSGNKASTL